MDQEEGDILEKCATKVKDGITTIGMYLKVLLLNQMFITIKNYSISALSESLTHTIIISQVIASRSIILKFVTHDASQGFVTLPSAIHN